VGSVDTAGEASGRALEELTQVRARADEPVDAAKLRSEDAKAETAALERLERNTQTAFFTLARELKILVEEHRSLVEALAASGFEVSPAPEES